MPFPIKMSPQSEGIKLQAFSKDLVPGAEGISVSVHSKKRNHEGSDKEGEKKKSKYINKIAKTLFKLFNRQWSEEKELQNVCRERKAKLEKAFKLESVVIHSIYSREAVRIDKLKILEAEHRQKLQELESEMSNRLNDMKARHCAEREAEEKKGIRKMNQLKSLTANGLSDNLNTEVVPAKSSSLSENNNLDKENINQLGPVDVHLPLLQPPEPHNVAAETSGSAEVNSDTERNVNNSDNGDILNSQTTIQINDEVEQTATSKNDLLSAENPALKRAADANEESSAATMEQHDEGSSSTHIESMNPPSTMNPSVVQPCLNMQQPQADCVPVHQEEHATSRASLSNEDACAETPRNIILESSDHPEGMPCSTSEQVVHNHVLPPEPPVPLDNNTGVSHHPVDLTQPCSYSSGVLVTPTYRTTTEAPNQGPGSLPACQEFDPLQIEYERLRGESNQVSRSHENLVSRLKSERDKEVEELVAEIRRKYESMVSEAVATFLQKKRELERYQFKVGMNMKLGEAFRCKCIDYRATAPQQVVPPNPFRRSPQNVNHSSSMPQMPLQEQTDGVICLSDDE